jgi:outer membrane protein TolC
LAVVAAAAPVAAERALTLSDAVGRALERNQTIAVERQGGEIAAAAVDRALAAYDFRLRLDSRYRNRTDPINSILSGAPPGEPAPDVDGWSFATSLSRLLGHGGTLALFSTVGRDWSDSQLWLVTPGYQTSLGVELRQPLLRDRTIDPARRQLRVARLDHDRSRSALARVVADTVAEVERAYWTLAAADRDVEVRQSSLALAHEQVAETRARIEAGVLSEADLAEPVAEVERRRGELLAAQEARRRAEHALKLLLLDQVSDPWWSEPLRPADPVETGVAAVALDEALGRALALRPEIEEACALVARQQVEVEASRDQLRPGLDLVASYAQRGLAGDPNPDAFPIGGSPVVTPPELEGGLGRSFGTLFDGLFPDFALGVQLSVPLGNHAARADVRAAGAGLGRAEVLLEQTRQRVAVEVRNAALAVETAAQRLEAARSSLAAARTQLAVEEERFRVGVSTNFLVLTRQNDLARALLTETAALVDYRRASTELDRSTGDLLARRQIEIVDRVAPPPLPAEEPGGNRGATP